VSRTLWIRTGRTIRRCRGLAACPHRNGRAPRLGHSGELMQRLSANCPAQVRASRSCQVHVRAPDDRQGWRLPQGSYWEPIRWHDGETVQATTVAKGGRICGLHCPSNPRHKSSERMHDRGDGPSRLPTLSHVAYVSAMPHRQVQARRPDRAVQRLIAGLPRCPSRLPSFVRPARKR